MNASHRARAAAAGSSSLDDRTWDDLHLDHVFAAFDRTESTLGQHALYHRMRTAPLADSLELFEALVERMRADAGSRERAQLALGRLQDPNGYDLWWLARSGGVETPAWHVLFPLLAAGAVAALAGTLMWPPAWPLLVISLGVNIAVRIAVDARVSSMADVFRQFAPLIRTAGSLAFLDGDDISPIVRPLHSSAPDLQRLKRLSRWLSGNPLMLPLEASWLLVLLNDAINVVYEYLNLFLLLDGNAVWLGAEELNRRRMLLLAVIAAIGEVDAAISVASFRAGTSAWTRPRFAAACAGIVMEDVRHPLVANAIPNSIRLGPPHGVLVTGSNMSGKSTFLRTIGVNVVLAQTINTVLATRYEAPVLSVQSCIGRTDDLMAGKSHYLVEVEAVLSLVRASASASPHLFLLDELFRGTNAVERIGAAEAVLAELVLIAQAPDGMEANGGQPHSRRFKPHLVLAATHDAELVECLRDSYAACHFSDALGPDGLAFDYRLVAGPATTRNAIALLRLQGASDTLVRRALARAAARER